MATNEVEEAVKRINSHKGVLGVLIVNNDGIPIKTTLEPAETVQHAALVTHFAKKTKGVIKALDPDNELTFVRTVEETRDSHRSGRGLLPGGAAEPAVRPADCDCWEGVRDLREGTPVGRWGTGRTAWRGPSS